MVLLLLIFSVFVVAIGIFMLIKHKKENEKTGIDENPIPNIINFNAQESKLI